MINKLKGLILIAVAFVPVIVSAQTGKPGVLIPDNPGGILPGTGVGDTLTTTIMALLKLFLQLVGLVAVLYLIYGGFRYITSTGNEKSVEAAKKTIFNALIGLVVIIMSYVIVNIVINATTGRV